MQTQTGINSPQAVKRWAISLAADVAEQAYMERFTGKGANNIIEVKSDLESDAGDEVRFDINMRFRQKPTYGDARLDGNEEALKFYQDVVRIDQVRKGGDVGGRMTRKRTLHNYRSQVRQNTGTYLAEWMDEIAFAYLSGTGPNEAINQDSLIMDDDELLQGFAQNPFQAPDDDHILYGGSATSKATLTAADTMSVALIERTVTKAKMMNALDRDNIMIRPVKVEGADHYVMAMSPFDSHNLRTGAGDREWNAIQRAAAGAEGRKNPIFKGGLGMINNVVLHDHSRVRRFDDYGVGANIDASRSLFMGAQAGMKAHGETNTGRYTWVEEPKDYGNSVGIAAGTICGMKKTRFNNRDYGVISVDCAAADPNAA
ncbi:N4-gp56 family major capsid protein [uncultured Roseobacter sp.]|uniref:N4-gp56 family major capsid protein n=1 Tax=uncultured Roseobacter sp. TaxID=114847 RepID=UPI00260C1AA4|nr:N4-gp56 family major capsid protein [uncultured Roseobacter sp.]